MKVSREKSQKRFTPQTISITIETMEELHNFWFRMQMTESAVESYTFKSNSEIERLFAEALDYDMKI